MSVHCRSCTCTEVEVIIDQVITCWEKLRETTLLTAEQSELIRQLGSKLNRLSLAARPKNLTEANGGRVEVQSEAGRGSVFAVTLPCGG